MELNELDFIFDPTRSGFGTYRNFSRLLNYINENIDASHSYLDASVNNLYSLNDVQDVSLGNLSNWNVNQDISINNVVSSFISSNVNFTGVFNLTNLNTMYNQYTNDSSLILTVGSNPLMGATARVLIVCDGTHSLTVDASLTKWIYSDNIDTSSGKQNLIVVEKTPEAVYYNVTILN